MEKSDKGRYPPETPFLRQAFFLDKEAEIRKRLAKSDSDDVRADAVRAKADAAYDAAKRMRGAKTLAARDQAIDNWEEAMNMPGAEEAAAKAKMLENDRMSEKDAEEVEDSQPAGNVVEDIRKTEQVLEGIEAAEDISDGKTA